MPVTALGEFVKKVLPHVPGCPEFLAEDAVRVATIELCDRGRIWRHDLAPISIVADTPEYALTPPAGSFIVDVLRVLVSGKPIDPQTKEELDRLVVDWTTQKDEVFGYFLKTDKRTIRLVYTPGEAVTDGLAIEVALKPSRSVSSIEEFIYEEYLDDIAEGAKWKLLEMPKKVWTDFVKARESRGLFDTAIAKAAQDSARSHSRAPLRTVSYYDIG